MVHYSGKRLLRNQAQVDTLLQETVQMMNFMSLSLMTLEKFLEQQVQFLRSLHSYQKQMMLRTLLEMRSIIRIMFQKDLTTSLLELQQETDLLHLVS